MKKILLAFIFILIASPVLAFGPAIQAVVSQSTAASGDSCTSGLLLSMHFENDDTITNGTPAGCSAGDTTLTKTNSTYTTDNAQDGSYALLFDNTSDMAALTVSGRDIVDERTGRIDLYWYCDNTGDGYIWRSFVTGQTGDHIRLYVSSQEFLLRYGTAGTGAIDVVTTDCNITAGTMYHIIGRWRQGATDPSMSIQCNAVAAVTINTNLFTDHTATFDAMQLGNADAEAARGKIDLLKIYNTFE